MSLINNMLKDLESREAKNIVLPTIPLIRDADRARDFSFLKSPFVLMGMLIVFLLLGSALMIFSKKHPTTLPAIPVEIPLTSVANNSTVNTDEWLKPVSITGITIQVKDNITELSLLLDHAALYQLRSDNLQNQFSIVMENAQLQAALPPINYLNTAISHINSQVVDKNNTLITLTLNAGAVIKYANLNDEGKNSELVIAIENNHPVNTPQNTASAVKSPIMQNMLEQQYQQAVSAAENGNYPLAIQTLTYLLQTDPTYKEARTSLVALLMDQGNQVMAKKMIDEGLKTAPVYVPFIELKARLLSSEGKTNSALTLLQTVSPPLSDNPEYHALIAALDERTNKNMLAANIYRQLVSFNPNNGSWWLGLGISLEKIGHQKEASEAYSTALMKGHLNADSVAYLQNHLQSLKEALHAAE